MPLTLESTTDYLTMVPKGSVYVVDIETDNLDEKYGSILEIGIVRVNLDSGIIYPVFNSIVNEGKKVNSEAWIFKNSSLKIEDVENSRSLEACRDALNNLFFRCIFTAFNHAFDFKWLESRGFNIPNRFFDPMEVLTPIMKLSFSHWKTPGKYKYPSVVEAVKYLFNIDFKEVHRALADATIEAKIVQKCYDLYF